MAFRAELSAVCPAHQNLRTVALVFRRNTGRGASAACVGLLGLSPVSLTA